MIGALYGLIFVLLCGLVAFGSLAVLLVEKNDRTERERDWYRTLAESSIRVNAQECSPGERAPIAPPGHFPLRGKQGQGGAGTEPAVRLYVAPEMEIVPATCESCRYVKNLETEPCRSCWDEYVLLGRILRHRDPNRMDGFCREDEKC